MTALTLEKAARAVFDRLLGISVEKLIAGSRLALAAGALVAIYFDPSQPAGGETGYLLLIGYVAFALVSLAAAWQSARTWQLPSHFVDICIITGVMYYTEGPTSPYFVLFSFLLFSATLQWEWIGAIVTGALLVLLVAALSLFGPVSPIDTGEVDRLIMRATYLLVASALFAYVGAYLARARRRLAQLAIWPVAPDAAGPDPSLDAPLAHAARVIDAKRALVIWERDDEPYRFLALWDGGAYEYRSEAPGAFGAIVSARYEPASFAFDSATSKLLDQHGWHQEPRPIHSSLVEHFRMRNGVTAPFFGARCSGRLFLLDLPKIDADDLPLVEIAAARMEDELDRHAREQDAQESVKIRERSRVARDLHDGILQTLTAARLRLTNLEPDTPENIRSRLHSIADILRREQLRLREFVEATERSVDVPATKTDGPHALSALVSDLANLWNCDVNVEIRPTQFALRESLAAHVRMMILEAVANAVRHGAADRIDIVIERQANAIALTVRDNGHGIMPEATACAQGSERALSPATLRERVAELGGDIHLASDASGVSVHIQLPVA